MSKEPLVLLVDDDPDIREIISYNLEKADYRVLTASDGIEGIKMCKKHKPDLVLMDVMMPGMSGFEVARELQFNEATKDIPIIFVTGFGIKEASTSVVPPEGYGYVVKPFTKAELANAIESVLFNG